MINLTINSTISSSISQRGIVMLLQILLLIVTSKESGIIRILSKKHADAIVSGV